MNAFYEHHQDHIQLWRSGNRTKNYLAGFGKNFQLLLSAT